MKCKLFVSILAILLLLSWLAPDTAQAGKPPPKDSTLVMNFNTLLEPGVWHGWTVAASEECGAYVVEVTPRKPGVNGAHVQKALVQPEFDGKGWNDVLRVQIPVEDPALKVNIRVYRTCKLPVVMDFETWLDPGGWNGWVVGPAAQRRGYLVEVSPLSPSSDGAYIEKAVVQQEYFMGDWQDVLRLQADAGFPDVHVHVRVYAVENAPILSEFDTSLDPGGWNGFILQPSKMKGGYVVEIDPLDIPEAGEYVERVHIQPEFNGVVWNDVLRLQAVADQPWIRVHVRVYAWR